MFVDINVLVYSTRSSSSFHGRAAAALAKAAGTEPRLAISRQVIREYQAVVTRPGGGSEPLTMVDALADIERFASGVRPARGWPRGRRAPGRALPQRCPRRAPGARRHNVATLLAHGETRLLTANRSDFQRFEPRIEVVGI